MNRAPLYAATALALSSGALNADTSSGSLADALGGDVALSWQPDDGWGGPVPLMARSRPYVRLGTGFGWFDDFTAEGLPAPLDPNIDAEFVWGGSFAWGIDFGRILGGAGESRYADVFALRARADIEIGWDAMFYSGTLVPPPDVSDGDGVITAWTFTVNGFLDLELPGPVSLFGGGGFGPALLTRNEDEFDSGDESLVAQWMAGVALQIDYDMDFYVAFRQRYYLTNPNFDGVKISDLTSSVVELGFNIRF